VAFRHNDPDWSAPFRRKPLPIQFVAEDDRWQIVVIFEHSAYRKRTPKHLFWVIVVIPIIENTPQVFARLGSPDDVAQWHTFPKTCPEGAADIQAGHRFDKADSAFLCHLHQAVEI